ncbi:MAG: LSU ribosomal protein L15p (L27Ae), partial [uncultured Acidimicrobiales bacterium]
EGPRSQAGPRLDEGQAPRRPRHRRQGRQDRRPRHQGSGRARHDPEGVRGRSAALGAAHPQAQGLQEPVPGGVRGGEPRSARRLPGRRDQPRDTPGTRPRAQARHGQGARSGRADPRPARVGPRLLQVSCRCHHCRGRYGRGHSAALRQRPAPGQGQCPDQPL